MLIFEALETRLERVRYPSTSLLNFIDLFLLLIIHSVLVDPLECFLQENTKTIAFRLLDRVLAAELIPSTVEKYVIPYAAKHNLVPDDLLLNYVEVKGIEYALL